MATRKHNDFLDADHSDDEGSQSQGYDSEAEDLKKGRRSPKRRKVESDDDASDNEEDLQDIDENGKDEEIKELEHSIDEKSKPKRLRKADDLPGVSKPLLKKNLVDTDKKIKRSGVVYISRIPPFMKPSKLRSLLSPYGTINRIFMTPEDPASHSKRVRSGGNKKRMFSDGWAEFTNKADAKNACELLNARIIGGKKGTYYHDDVWNLKYLKNFKWNSLTEQIAAENAERTSRMRAEISRTTKENKEFVQNVERAKMLEGMQSKESAKRKKDGKDHEDKGGVEDERFAAPVPKKQKKGGERAKVFGQNKVVKKKKPVEKAAQSEQVKRVLSQIF